MASPGNNGFFDLSQKDLQDPTLFRLNNDFRYLWSKQGLLLTPGGQPAFPVTPSFRRVLVTQQTTPPTDGNELLTRASADALYGPAAQRQALLTGAYPQGGTTQIQPLPSGGGSSTVIQSINLYGTHAARPLPGTVATGIFYTETDRTVLYQQQGGSWIYVAGVMDGTISPDHRPSDLGANDVGFLYFATDSGTLYQWTGAAWRIVSTGSPAIADQEIVYSKAGAFFGDANLKWDYTTQNLLVTGNVRNTAHNLFNLGDNTNEWSNVYSVTYNAGKNGVAGVIFIYNGISSTPSVIIGNNASGVFGQVDLQVGPLFGGGSFFPVTSNVSLGLSGRPWANAFIGTTTLSGNITPISDAVFNLGNSALEFSTIFARTHQAGTTGHQGIVTVYNAGSIPWVMSGSSGSGGIDLTVGPLFGSGSLAPLNTTTDLGYSGAIWRSVWVNNLHLMVNTTGGGSAALGANCPAGTPGAPYTWVQATSSDGSTVYFPVWK